MKKPTIVLIGDSILDNSYWDGVGNTNTGQLLKHLGSKPGILRPFKVKDHSTEELTSERLLTALKGSDYVDVGSNYVAARKALGYPYPGRGGKVPISPKN